MSAQGVMKVTTLVPMRNSGESGKRARLAELKPAVYCGNMVSCVPVAT
jgi:hypothetical protein